MTLLCVYYKHDCLNLCSVMHFDVAQQKRGLKTDVCAAVLTLTEGKFFVLGQYLYTEASFPAQRGMVARFKSPAIIQFGSLEKCLQLWYNMNGEMIGAVRLLKSDIFTGVEKEIWKASGNKGDKWNEAKITIRSRNPFRVRKTFCTEFRKIAISGSRI